MTALQETLLGCGSVNGTQTKEHRIVNWKVDEMTRS